MYAHYVCTLSAETWKEKRIAPSDMNVYTLLITIAAYAPMTYEVDVFVERDIYKRGSNIIFSTSLFWEKKENRCKCSSPCPDMMEDLHRCSLVSSNIVFASWWLNSSMCEQESQSHTSLFLPLLLFFQIINSLTHSPQRTNQSRSQGRRRWTHRICPPSLQAWSEQVRTSYGPASQALLWKFSRS